MPARVSPDGRGDWARALTGGSGGGGPATRVLGNFWRAIVALAAVGTAVTIAILAGAGVGLAGVAAVLILVIMVFVSVVVHHAAVGRRLRREAFVWTDLAADAEPVADFSVRSWRGRNPAETPPVYVERNVTAKLRRGLDEKRFVILIGPRASGKSRLIFELMKNEPRTVLVSHALFAGGRTDPLLRLMVDHPSFWGTDGPQTLVMRSLTARLLAGTVDHRFFRHWLDRHPSISIIATFNDNDLARIDETGEEGSEAFEALKQEAAVVRLSAELEGREVETARQLYPDLDAERRRFLPRYLCSTPLLEERFGTAAEGNHALGQAIARAAADWARAGISRPAPRRYLEAAAPRYLDGPPGDFDAELDWALQSLEEAAALLYLVEEDGVEMGFAADATVRDLCETTADGGLDSSLPKFAWESICEELFRAAEETDLLGPVEDLIAFDRAARSRGGPDLEERLIKLVPDLDSFGQRERLVDRLVAGPAEGSVRSLISTRVGDGIYRRLTAVQQLAEAPRMKAGAGPHFGDRFLARIYVFRTARALARLAVLVVMDALSADVGFLGGLAVLYWLSGGPHLDGGALGRLSAAAGATTVGVFAVCGLYREDAPRAQLPAILLAVCALGFVGVTVAAEQHLALDAAVAAAFAGAALTACTADLLRTGYDRVSRHWVKEHGFEARTLLIGTEEQVAEARIAISDISRPTEVIGHLTPKGPAGPDALGRIAELPEVADIERVGRVLIVDPDMAPAERQELADFCHAQGLLVEAMPSLADLLPGGTEVLLGQSSILMRLEPLWQRSPGFFLKRTFDVLVAAFLVALLSPLFFFIAVAVAIDCGRPIFVRTLRPGLGGKTFGMFRFRTTVDVFASPFELTDIDEDPGGGGATSLGRFLRRHGLDEMPQFANVLLGEMSLVGPRPLPLAQHLELDEEDLRRYVVRPGITGPWMVCGRTSLTYSELTILDIAYLRQWTFFTDLAVLAKTLRLMVFTRRSFPQLLRKGEEGALSSSTASG